MLMALKKFWSEEDGQGMVEYGLILGLVAIVAVLALTNLGAQIKAAFESIVAELSGVTGTGTT